MKNSRKEAPNTYISNRDHTAGRNNDNPGLTKLDQNYAKHPSRQGTSQPKPLNYKNDNGRVDGTTAQEAPEK